MSEKPQSLRIGVTVPTGNVVHAREFAALAPAGVEFRFAEFSYPPPGGDFCGAIVGQMAHPLGALRDWGADLVLIGCTTVSMTCADETFTAQLEALAGAPVATAAGATRAAIAALGLDVLSVATPYGEVNNRIVETFLTEAGVKVAAIEGLNLDRAPDVWRAEAPALTGEQVLALGRSVDRAESQGLYLPCTGIASLEAIDRFEAATGKPAFSSVQAGYWASLKRLGYDGRRAGAGRLLETWDF